VFWLWFAEITLLQNALIKQSHEIDLKVLFSILKYPAFLVTFSLFTIRSEWSRTALGASSTKWHLVLPIWASCWSFSWYLQNLSLYVAFFCYWPSINQNMATCLEWKRQGLARKKSTHSMQHERKPIAHVLHLSTFSQMLHPNTKLPAITI